MFEGLKSTYGKSSNGQTSLKSQIYYTWGKVANV